MAFTEESRMGQILQSQSGRDVLERHIPGVTKSTLLVFGRGRTLKEFASLNPASPWSDDVLEALVRDLATLPDEAPVDVEYMPAADYEDASVSIGSADILAPVRVEQWGVFELELHGPSHGNPFTDVSLAATFSQADRTMSVPGFYDGSGTYRIRFMPDAEGVWSYGTTSNARSLDHIEGRFTCTSPAVGNHGPVRVANTFHFAYADGTRYLPVGTTCYAWTHQGDALEEQTLETLQTAPFNKMRMCVFPKSYLYNTNEPAYYPFEGNVEQGWDTTRFSPKFFQHLEERIRDLDKLGIEADLILFHPYDRWGFSEMTKGADNRYLRYLVARLAAYRNVWWSLANEYDLMWSKGIDDWERFAVIIGAYDPYRHLMSIHNCHAFYDLARPWITHCSIQRTDVYKTAENTVEWREQWNKPVVIDECAYEGDIDQGWGNITAEEMVRRFWEGAVRGGYVGHGETYMHPEDILWWAKGGKLHGESPERIKFLKKIMEQGPIDGWNPLFTSWDVATAGISGEYYLFYYGFNRPSFREYWMAPGSRYQVERIDTWNMTVDKLDGIFEGSFRIALPSRQYMAVRMTRV